MTLQIPKQTCIDCHRLQADAAKVESCSICALINEGITEFVAQKFPEVENGAKDVRVIRVYTRGSDCESFKLSLGSRSCRIGFFISGISDFALRRVCRGLRRVPRQASVEERLSLAASWLRKCQDDHIQCHGFLWQPARLLQLDAFDESVVLVETAKMLKLGPPANPSYACLSHCWGKSQPLRTTASNIESMKTEIGWDALPRTFQDAVTVARSLGLPWLWIDSLCIVQDDEEDWNIESQKMASIYGSATLTIAASKSPDCHTGFLEESSIGAIPISTSAGTVWIREMLPHIYSPREDDDQDDIENSLKRNPLDLRAWSFQEHLLARRTLLFGCDEMYWLCRGRHDCECGDGMSTRLRFDLVRRGGAPSQAFVQNMLLASMAPSNPLEPMSHFGAFAETWRSVVEHYSTRQLTFDKDRLVALAGIIARLSETINATCHAGHWLGRADQAKIGLERLEQRAAGQEEFIQSLCWQHKGRRPKVFRAPTWSWAAVEGTLGVSHALNATNAFDELDYSDVGWVVNDYLRCPAIPKAHDQFRFTQRALKLWDATCFDARIRRSDEHMVVYSDVPEPSTRFSFEFEEDCRGDPSWTGHVKCVILATRKTSRDMVRPGVVLICKPSDTFKCYERMGLWNQQEHVRTLELHRDGQFCRREDVTIV